MSVAISMNFKPYSRAFLSPSARVHTYTGLTLVESMISARVNSHDTEDTRVLADLAFVADPVPRAGSHGGRRKRDQTIIT